MGGGERRSAVAHVEGDGRCNDHHGDGQHDGGSAGQGQLADLLRNRQSPVPLVQGVLETGERPTARCMPEIGGELLRRRDFFFRYRIADHVH